MGDRVSQAERRERTRAVLLEAAARGISRDGYAGLVLERVAKDAGVTRGAIYHQFSGKEELALAVVAWVAETWRTDVLVPALTSRDPVDVLVAVARGHVRYCRRDVARVMIALRVEFDTRDHPVGVAVRGALDEVLGDARGVIDAGRATGRISAGPPSTEALALALGGAIEGIAIECRGRHDDDELLAERAVLGLLGIDPTSRVGGR